jgi:ABC-2 type transport system ATP-binding protein
VNSDCVIELGNVSYFIREGFFLKKKFIIDKLSFSVKKGSVTGLIGPNGAGKTTTIKLICGLIKPSSGTVSYSSNGIDNFNIGVLTEQQYFYPHLTLYEWLFFLGSLSGLTERKLKNSIESNLEKFDLCDKKNIFMRNLSKGQVQRAGFIQAVLHDPEILVLDEPMSGLDPLWRHRIQEMILEFNKEGKTIIFSSHIMSDILYMSDELIVVNQGRLKWNGNINQIDKKNKFYNISVAAENLFSIESVLPGHKIYPDKNGIYRFIVNESDKNKLLKYTSEFQGIYIYSIIPVYAQFEDLFYGN